MTPSSVPKPTSAGEGKLAIAKTNAGYVNIRTGPGTNYTDIGDIYNMTHVICYPASKTSTGWVWIEQYGTSG